MIYGFVVVLSHGCVICVYGEKMNKNQETYFCVICEKELPIIDGVVVHDEIPHPDNIILDSDLEKIEQ